MKSISNILFLSLNKTYIEVQKFHHFSVMLDSFNNFIYNRVLFKPKTQLNLTPNLETKLGDITTHIVEFNLSLTLI